MPPHESRSPTERELKVLADHGWGNCQKSVSRRYCWHHGFYDIGNAWHSTEEALERTQNDASKLLAFMAGEGPSEDGYADTYDVMRFDPAEREAKAAAGRRREGFPRCTHSNLMAAMGGPLVCADCGKEMTERAA